MVTTKPFIPILPSYIRIRSIIIKGKSVFSHHISYYRAFSVTYSSVQKDHFKPSLITVFQSLPWRYNFITFPGQLLRRRHHSDHSRHGPLNTRPSPETVAGQSISRVVKVVEKLGLRWRWDRAWRLPVRRWLSVWLRKLIRIRFGRSLMPPVIRLLFSICILNGKLIILHLMLFISLIYMHFMYISHICIDDWCVEL